jgi:hypothetical protein
LNRWYEDPLGRSKVWEYVHELWIISFFLILRFLEVKFEGDINFSSLMER